MAFFSINLALQSLYPLLPLPLCALFLADAATLSARHVIVPKQRDDPHDLFVIAGAQTDHYTHCMSGTNQLWTL